MVFVVLVFEYELVGMCVYMGVEFMGVGVFVFFGLIGVFYVFWILLVL